MNLAGGKRISDRITKRGESSHIKNEEIPVPSLDKVLPKIGKESISAIELAVYLSYLRGLKEPDCINEKTIRRYIDKLCKMSGRILKTSEFKTGENNAYEFKPEYHDILIALLDTDYFGGNKNDKKIEDRAHLHAQIASNIGKYVQGKDRKKLQNDPSYLNANLEAKLMPIITNELTCMLNLMYNADPTIRYQYMLECMDRLVGIRRWMNEWNERIKIIRRSFAGNDVEKIKMADAEEGSFKNDMLDMLMIKVLDARRKNEEYHYITDNEELSYPATYLASKQYDISLLTESSLYQWVKQVEINVSSTMRYQSIMDRLNTVLDKNDLLEGKILNSLDKIVRSEIVAACADVTPYDYNRLIRFTEDSMREDKEKIRDICDEKVDVKLSKEVLDEIMAIKDRVERKKNVGHSTLQ
nr:hypothetical protein [uncultured Niameybacter sp.]